MLRTAKLLPGVVDERQFHGHIVENTFQQDLPFAARVAEERAAAMRQLLQEMESRGLRVQDGWTLWESIREAGMDGCEILFTPVHRHLRDAINLESVVLISMNCNSIAARLEPGDD